MYFLYLTFGIFYLLYITTKILQNKQTFLIVFEKEYGMDKLYSYFIVLFISCLFMWPIMMIAEINKEKDL